MSDLITVQECKNCVLEGKELMHGLAKSIRENKPADPLLISAITNPSISNSSRNYWLRQGILEAIVE